MTDGLRGLLKTRIARRIFFLFVLSAFLPLAVIAAMSLDEVRSMLLQQGEQRLAANAKVYGMNVFERLQLAAEVASSAAAHPDRPRHADSLAARIFLTLTVAGSGPPVSLLGEGAGPELPAEARARVAAGKTAVFLGGEKHAPRIFLAASAAPPAGSYVVGALRDSFLWGPADELPAATEFCVVEEGRGRLLQCTAPNGSPAVGVLDANGHLVKLAAVWDRDGEAMRARVWAQFMRVEFGTPDWVVVASQSERVLLARLFAFRELYIPVVGLALVLVMWLTLRQSRDIVQPVELLAERARGIARNEFDGRLDLQRNDEFGELGGAFDQMSQRLGQQFASLTALAEIDQLMLSTQDTAVIVLTVLKRLAAVVPADLVSVTLFDHHNKDNARTYSLARGAEEPTLIRHGMSASDRAKLRPGPESWWITLNPAEPAPSYLEPARADGMSGALVQPIVWRDETCGAIVLAHRSATFATDDERQSARELADRMAVAVSSAWRDEQLYAQAHFDTLTGAPNRLLFTDRLRIEIARSERERLVFALLFVDLDHFKTVNDSFGHTAGDQVLREAVARIGKCVRSSDTVARLGGDEFTVLLTRLHDPQEAWLIAETVVAALSREFILDGQQYFLSASVGIAAYPADGSTPEALLKSADTAMYRAKANGRSQVVFFEERMNAEAIMRLTLDRDLRKAIERGEFELHYQPKMELASGRIRSAEALIRWRHPTRGLIAPLKFIALAEESGFIEQIGHWTLQEACAQMRKWRDEGIVLDHVSVNVSPRQFRKRSLVSFITQCALNAGLRPSNIQVEITEGLLMDSGETVEGMLRQLADNGHGIALDDFGTGFSSMAYLKRFAVHAIKIDRVFVDGLERSADSEAIVSAIVAMSHALGKRVIAEGVETQEQLALLRKLRCDDIQGYLVAPPLTPDAFARLLTARHRASA